MSLQVSALQNLPEVTVRFYRNADFDHARRVIREIGATHLGHQFCEWDKSFTEIYGFMWVACVDDLPVAFAGMAPLSSDGIAHLHTDLVSPAYQRRGLGTLLTLTRFAAMADDAVDRIGVLATEHSAPYYQRFGFELEVPPQLDSLEGYHIHRMSMPYAPLLSQSADAVLDSLPQVSFDLSVDDDPFAGEETTSSHPR